MLFVLWQAMEARRGPEDQGASTRRLDEEAGGRSPSGTEVVQYGFGAR
jgi:hypothetical protein